MANVKNIQSKAPLSSLSTIGSTTTGNHRTSSLMSLNPLAPVFFSSYQSSSNPPVSLCNSTTMGLPVAQLICGMPPQLAPPINQYNSDNTLLLPLLQQTDQSNPDAAAHQPTPGSSASLPSSLQHQSNCLQAINKTLKQFNQHLKAEQLDRQTLQLILFQLQNDFALLRYLLFSPVETTSNTNFTVKDSATSPIFTSKANPNSNPTSATLTFPSPGELKLHRFTPVGAVGPPRTKSNNSANADFQLRYNTQEAPSTTVQNLSSRICKLEKLFADEISAYTSVTAGIHSPYFFLYDKLRQLEPGHSDVIIWKIPSVKFIFDSAKVARPSSDPLIEPATSFSSHIFRTHPHGYNFFIKLYTYGIGPATGKCASILFTLFPGDYDNLLQWPFTKIIHIGIRDQLDPMNAWMKTIRPDQDPAYKKPTMTTKTGVATILINNFIPHSKRFSETEGFLIDGARIIDIKFSDPPVLKPHTQTSLLSPFP